MFRFEKLTNRFWRQPIEFCVVCMDGWGRAISTNDGYVPSKYEIR